MKKTFMGKLTLLTFTIFTLFFSFVSISIVSADKIVQISSKEDKKTGILKFEKKLQLELGELDEKGRATGAHIQLQKNDLPTVTREPKINVDPVGWHNYKFFYGDGSKQSWLMNRGHLIGYQFSGLNDELKNLVPMTAWVNTGNYEGTNINNKKSILYYETKLIKWLNDNPDKWLDYKVTPIYSKKNYLIPDKIELRYVAINTNGKREKIKLGGEERHKKDIGIVTLKNTSPNAKLDYKEGTAENTIKKAK